MADQNTNDPNQLERLDKLIDSNLLQRYDTNLKSYLDGRYKRKKSASSDTIHVTDVIGVDEGILVYYSNGTIKLIPILAQTSDPVFITPSEVEAMFTSDGSQEAEVPDGDIMTETEALGYLEEDN